MVTVVFALFFVVFIFHENLIRIYINSLCVDTGERVTVEKKVTIVTKSFISIDIAEG